MAFVKFTAGQNQYLIGPTGNLDHINPRIGPRSQAMIQRNGKYAGPYSSEAAKAAARVIRTAAATTGNALCASALAVDDHDLPIEEIRATAPVIDETPVSWRGITPYKRNGYWHHRFQLGESTYSVKGRTPQDVIDQLQSPLYADYLKTLPAEIIEAFAPATPEAVAEVVIEPKKVLRPGSQALTELPKRVSEEQSSRPVVSEQFRQFYNSLTAAEAKKRYLTDPNFRAAVDAL